MKKYLFISDVHLNINRRLDITKSALKKASEIAFERKVDNIVITGDIYTSRKPHSAERDVFHMWINETRVNRPELRDYIVIIPGNHDSYPDGLDAFSEFRRLNIEGVCVLDNMTVWEGLFLGHILLKEAKIGTQDYHVDTAPALAEIINKYPALAYIFGDVHKHQILSTNPLALYVGSLIPVDFGERNDKKGVILVTVNDDFTVDYEFIEIDLLDLVQLDVDMAKLDTESFDNLLLSFRTSANRLNEPNRSILKIVFRGTEHQLGTIDEGAIRRIFEYRVRELSMEYEIVSTEGIDSEAISEVTNPIDALRSYLDSKHTDIDLPMRDQIFSVGVGVIKNASS